MNKSTTCQTIALQEVAPHSKREENQEQELRMYLSQESKLCYDKMNISLLSCPINHPNNGQED
jgi:hypothetical protein